MYNVNGVTPLIAGESRLSPSTLEAIRQKESEETDEYIDFRNDPVVCKAVRLCTNRAKFFLVLGRRRARSYIVCIQDW